MKGAMTAEPFWVYTTGGTIDASKDYDPKRPCVFDGYRIPQMFAQLELPFDYYIEQLMQKDSALLDQADWEQIHRACTECPGNKIIITCGTTAMCLLARFLGARGIPGKTIILVGAFVPFTQDGSDALPNLRFAVDALATAGEGVWVAMSGQIFAWKHVRKNEELNRFEYI